MPGLEEQDSEAFVLPTDNSSVLEAALLYAKAGFSPIPVYGVNGTRCDCGRADCSAAGKHPVGSNWQKRTRADVDVARDLFADHRGNVGIMLGDEFVIVDIDGYSGGYDGVKQLPSMPPTLTQKSGSGRGEHRIFRLAPGQDPRAITNRKVAPGVDVKVRAGQFVAAPSMHSSGQRYQWTNPIQPATLPADLYEAIKKPNVIPIRPTSTSRPSVVDEEKLLKRATAYMEKISPAISGQEGHAQTFAAARALWGWVNAGLPENAAWNLFVEWNTQCEPPWSERELDHKWSEAKKASNIPVFEDRPRNDKASARGPAPAADPGAEDVFDEAPPFDGPLPPTDDEDGGEGGGDGGDGGGVPPNPDDNSWRSMLVYDRNKSGPDKPAKHHENALVALKFCPAWKGKVRLDIHAQRIFVTNPPWHDWHLPTEVEVVREWTDADDTRLSSWLRREVVGLTLSPEQCNRAVVVAAEAAKYHPFRDYLDGLVWDGVPRLDDWLVNMLGAKPVVAGNEPIVSKMGAWWLIGAVARTYRPGCKMDYVLILEGFQGLKKSSALKVLASPKYFSDTPIDLGNKDAYMVLQGKVIVELAELTSLQGARKDAAKAFFSSTSDRYRPPYGRAVIEVPRMSVFAGTVNPGDYLTDDTGNRRYFPVQCHSIDLAKLEADRDQLWAEATCRFKADERWWPDSREEFVALEGEQLAREETDPWAEAIHYWATGRTECTSHQVLEGAVKLAVEDMTRQHEMRAARVLHQLGFERVRARRQGRLCWVFVRSTTKEGA